LVPKTAFLQVELQPEIRSPKHKTAGAEVVGDAGGLLSSEKRNFGRVLKAFVLKMAQVKAIIWP